MMMRSFLLRLLPYLFVGMGLYLFGSAWFAMAGYHLSILLVLGLYKKFGLALIVKPGKNEISFA